MSKENYEEELVKLEKGVSYLGLLLGMASGLTVCWLEISRTLIEKCLGVATLFLLITIIFVWMRFPSILAELR